MGSSPSSHDRTAQESRQTLNEARTVYDPADPMGKCFFNILATFAEFEVDLLRMRIREGMAIARAKGKLKGKPPKLSPTQRALLLKLTRLASTRSPSLPSCSPSAAQPSTENSLESTRPPGQRLAEPLINGRGQGRPFR